MKRTRLVYRKEVTIKNRILSTLSLFILSVALVLTLCSASESAAVKAQDFLQIYINEICAKNTTIDDGNGNYYDWVELYNAGAEDCNLNGFGLSDSGEEPYKYTFTSDTIIPAQGYLVIYCDKKAAAADASIAGFGLSTDGDSIYLSRPADGTVIDSVTFGSVDSDVSYGRLDTDLNALCYFDVMSPGQINDADNVLVHTPMFSHGSGFYDNAIDLNITCDDGCSIYYTLDGSVPTASGTLYNGSIAITDISDSANVLAARTDISLYGYTNPAPVDKAMIVNAVAVNNATGKTSQVMTGTYFVGSKMKNKYSNELVISVVTDADNLFDYYNGIYVLGESYDKEGKNSSLADYFKPANYHNKGKEWERPATVQVFSDASGSSQMVLSENIGIRIHGGASRSWVQKSFSFYARGEYGASKLQYDFYQSPLWDGKRITKFDSIMIRNAGNDNDSVRFRDKLNQKLIEGRNLALQGMTPAIVFINGEYWGHYELTEKLSDYYIQSHYGVDEENVIMVKNNELEEGIEGDLQEWTDLCTWVRNTDFSIPANYDLIREKIDIQSFIDYMSFEIYISNNDWGEKNKAWWKARTVDTSNPYADGKWRFIVFDTEYSDSEYGDYTGTNNFNTVLNGNNDYDIFVIFRKLWSNSEFKKQFSNSFLDIANYNFSYDKVNALITEYSYKYQGYAADYYTRFHKGSNPNYSGKLKTVRDFFSGRYDKIVGYMKTTLGLRGNLVSVTVSNDASSGTIYLNTLTPSLSEAGTWTGKYYTDYPVHVKAAPESGKAFQYYEVTNSQGTEYIYDAEADIALTGDTTITAVYSADDNVKGMPYIYNNGRIYDVTVPHVLINQVYGGAKKESYASHSFIELYNPTDETIDLSGWALHYRSSLKGDDSSGWSMKELSGSIPAHSSYLVRCGAVKNPAEGSITIDNYDLSWDKVINNKGCTIVLTANARPIAADAEIFNNTTGKPVIIGYVDMIGVSGNDTDTDELIVQEAAPFYEKAASQVQSKKKGVRRKAFADTDDNTVEGDLEAVDYSFGNAAYITYISPKCTADGAWVYDANAVPGFNVQYVKYGNITEQQHYDFISTMEKPSDPERTGYVFTGWYEDEACNTEFVFPKEPVTDITLYAGWDPVEYAISYNGVGDATNSNPLTYTVETGEIELAKPVSENKVFVGWYDNADFSGSQVTAIPAGSAGNKILYARWKEAVSFSAPTALNGLVYNAQEQALVSAGTINGGTLYFVVKTDESVPSSKDYTTSIPKAVNAGSYYVWYKVAGDPYHLDSEPAYVNVTVSKAFVTVYPDNKGKKFKEADPALTASVSGLKGSDTAKVLSFKLSRAAGETAGTYAITATGEAVQGNYNVTFATGVFTIGETVISDPTIELSEKVFVYDGSSKTPAVTVTDGKAVIAPENYTVEYRDNVNAGTATVTIAGKQGGSYVINGKTSFTIEKATPALTVSINGWTYGQTAGKPAVSGNSGNGTVEYTYKQKGAGDDKFSSAVPSAAGEYSVRAVVSETDNYKSAEARADFVIAAGSSAEGGTTGGGSTGGSSGGGSTGGSSGSGSTGGYTGGGLSGGSSGSGSTGGYTGGGSSGGSGSGGSTGGYTGGGSSGGSGSGGSTGGYTGGGSSGGSGSGGSTGDSSGSGSTGGYTGGGSSGGSGSNGSIGGSTGGSTGGSSATGETSTGEKPDNTAPAPTPVITEQTNKDGSVTTITVQENSDGTKTTDERTVNKDGSSHETETVTTKNGYTSVEKNTDVEGKTEIITTVYEKTADTTKTMTVTEKDNTKVTETVTVTKGGITTTETITETGDSKIIETVTETKKKNSTITETVIDTGDSKTVETVTETQKKNSTVTETVTETEDTKITETVTRKATKTTTVIVSEVPEGVKTEKIVENSKGTRTITSDFVGEDGDKVSITGKIYKSGKASLEITEESPDGPVQKWKLKNASDALEIVGLTSEFKSVVVPTEVIIGGEPIAITTIGKGFLSDPAQLESIELGAAVTSIEPGAFKDASNLKEIIISAGELDSIPAGAFEGIANKAVFTIKATKKQYKVLKQLLTESGLPKKVKFKRISPAK